MKSSDIMSLRLIISKRISLQSYLVQVENYGKVSPCSQAQPLKECVGWKQLKLERSCTTCQNLQLTRDYTNREVTK